MGLSKVWFSFIKHPFVAKYKKAIFFLLTFTIVYSSFYEFSPVLYDKHYVLWTFFFGILGTFCFAVFLFSFLADNSKDDPYLLRGDRGGYILGISIIGFFFGYSIYLLFYQVQKKQRLIKEQGVYTIALKVDQFALDLRKVDMSYITLGFYDTAKIYHEVKYEASAAEVKKYKNQQYIPIVYVRDYPDLLRPIAGHASFKKLAHVESRDILFDDVLYILEHPELKGQSLARYLNSIKQYWQESESSKNEFTNIFTQETIQLQEEERLKYTYPMDIYSQDYFYNSLRKLEYTRDTGIHYRLVYRNEFYEIEFVKHNPTYNNVDSDFDYIKTCYIRRIGKGNKR